MNFIMGLSPVFILCLCLVGASHGGYLTKREFETDPEGSLNFALRSMELGLDFEKQDALRKRGFEIRQEAECAQCGVPKMPENPCEHGYTPDIKAKKGKDCSCIEAYKCCNPPPCPGLTDDDWKKCDKDPFGVGKYYAEAGEDCCDCPSVTCRECPKIILGKPPKDWNKDGKNRTHEYFWCANECDEAVPTTDAKNCPKYYCKRKPKPIYTKPNCSKQCHDLETKTDKCGYSYQECACRRPPQCTPVKPPEIDCHTITQKTLGYYGCDKENDKLCVQCYQWVYDLIKPDYQQKTCKPCEIEKQRDTGCGSFETICQCRNPLNCEPKKPKEIPCHKIEKKENADPASSKCNADTKKCNRCYHWVYVPDFPEPGPEVNCDKRCQFKKPLAQECGSGSECVCIGRSKEQCRPKEPKPPACFSVQKKMIEDSFMCAGKTVEGREEEEEEEEGPTELRRYLENAVGGLQKRRTEPKQCLMCHAWEYVRKPCPVQKPPQCDSNCQTTVQKHLECNCYASVCKSTVLPKCEPAEPQPNLECFTKPEKVYREGVYSWHAELKKCVRCYNWKYEAKKIPSVDECTLRHLPGKCFSEYSVVGKCNSHIKQCNKNAVSCTELYPGSEEDVCPNGHVKLRFKNTCGDARDVCGNCNTIAYQNWGYIYADKCYDKKQVTIAGKCSLTVKLKKRCPVADRLSVDPCELKGQKRRLYFDDCDCPALKCTGCPATKAVDMQLLLDSSGSVGATAWTRMVQCWIVTSWTPSSQTRHPDWP